MDNNTIQKVYKIVYCLKPSIDKTNSSTSTVDRKNGFVIIEFFRGNKKKFASYRRKKLEAQETKKLNKQIQQNTNIFNRRRIIRRRGRRNRKKFNWPTQVFKNFIELTTKINEKLFSFFKGEFIKQGLLNNVLKQTNEQIEKAEYSRKNHLNDKEGKQKDVVVGESKTDNIAKEEEDVKQTIQDENKNGINPIKNNKEENIKEGKSSTEEIDQSMSKKEESNRTGSSEEDTTKDNTTKDDIIKEGDKEEIIHDQNHKEESIQGESFKEEIFLVANNIEELNFTMIKKHEYTEKKKRKKKKKSKSCCRYVSNNEDQTSTDYQDIENEHQKKNELKIKNENIDMYKIYENLFTSNKLPQIYNMNALNNTNIFQNINSMNDINLLGNMKNIVITNSVKDFKIAANPNIPAVFGESNIQTNGSIPFNIYNKNKCFYANNMQKYALNNLRLSEISKTKKTKKRNYNIFSFWFNRNKEKKETLQKTRSKDIPTVPKKESKNFYLKENMKETLKMSSDELPNIKYYYVSTINKKTKQRKTRKVSLIRICKEPNFFIAEKFLSDVEAYLALNHCLMHVQKNQNQLSQVHDNFYSILINIDDTSFLSQPVSTSILRHILKRFNTLFRIAVGNVNALEFCLYIKKDHIQANEKKHIFREHNIYKYSVLIFLNTTSCSFVDFPNKGILMMPILGNCLIYECNTTDNVNPFTFNISDEKICFLKLNLTEDLKFNEVFNKWKETGATTAVNCRKEETTMDNKLLHNYAPKNNPINDIILWKGSDIADTFNKNYVNSKNANYPFAPFNNEESIIDQKYVDAVNNNQNLIKKTVDQINNTFRILNISSMQKLMSNRVDHLNNTHSTMIENYLA